VKICLKLAGLQRSAVFAKMIQYKKSRPPLKFRSHSLIVFKQTASIAATICSIFLDWRLAWNFHSASLFV